MDSLLVTITTSWQALFQTVRKEGSPRSFDIVGIFNRAMTHRLFAQYSVNVNLKGSTKFDFSGREK